MSSLIRIGALLTVATLSVSLPLFAVAQDATTPASEAPAEAPADAPAEAPADAPATPEAGQTVTPDDGLSLGQSPDGGVGSTYVKEEFGAWQMRCVKTEDGMDPCQLYQLLEDAAGNPVAEFSLFTVPSGGQAVAGATAITPLETLLPANLRLAVDAAQAKVYPYSFCSRMGCFSRLGFTQEDLDAFRRGTTAKVIIVPAAAPGETVDLTMSLSGFTAGWTALEAANAAAAAQ